MNDITITDRLVPSQTGQLFARQWMPVGTDHLTPIVMLHDSLGSVELWRDFPQKLAQATGRKVVAYDRMGFGRSSPNPNRLAADFIKDEGRTGLSDVCRALGIGPVILLGHSVGGGMALSAGATLADRVQAIISLSAQAFVEDRTLEGVRQAKIQFQAPDQMARLAKYHGDKAPWVLDAWIETWLDPAYAGWSLDEDLVGLRCPVLCVHGEEDEFGSMAHPQRIVALASSPVEMVMIDGGGHMPHKEDQPRLLALISGFLEANARA